MNWIVIAMKVDIARIEVYFNVHDFGRGAQDLR